MNSISGSQLAAMLLISDVFSLFCLSGEISVMTAAAFLTAIALQLLIAMPLIAMFGSGRSLCKVAKLLCLAWLIVWGGMLLRMQWNTSEVISVPLESTGGIRGKLLISGLIALVCLYISSTGIKALARASVIAAAVGAVGLAVVIVSAVFTSDAENLSREASQRSFLGETVRCFSLSGGLGSLIVLLGVTDGSEKKTVSSYFFCKAAVTAAITLTAVLVAGGIMAIEDFPVAVAAQLSQPFSVQRIDSLFLINFAVFAVFAVAVQSAAAAMLIGQVFPRFRRYRCSAVLVLMIVTALVLPDNELFTAAAVSGLLIAVPAISFIFGKKVPKRSIT